MRAYFARLNDQQEHPHELVGIFVASSHEMLCDLVDECCDVESVEVVEMGQGGVYWGGRVDYRLPYEGDVEEMPNFPGDASLSDLWLHVTDRSVEWQQLSWEEELA